MRANGRRLLRVRLGVSLVAATISVTAAPSALAHPQGTLSINHWAGIEIDSAGVTVKYLLDFAEIPSFAELERVDPDGDDQVTPQERKAYLEERSVEVFERLRLEVNGAPLPIESEWSRVVFPPGDDGMSTVRIAWELRADFAAPLLASNFLVWTDRNHEAAPGWKEIRFSARSGLGIGRSSIAPRDDAGAVFPETTASPPPTDTKGWCQFGVGMTPASAGELPTRAEPGGDRGSRFSWILLPGLFLGLAGGLVAYRLRRRAG